jgi:hypothetical protein
MSLSREKIESYMQKLEETVVEETFIDYPEPAEDLVEKLQSLWSALTDEDQDYVIFARDVIYGRDDIHEPTEYDEWQDFDPDC